ncbi:MAG: sugar ABC transporter substrate-binding protein [Caloramator sp.]|nr:sugar ABC transporter substrate-binding protein [Caloramator sp.]
MKSKKILYLLLVLILLSTFLSGCRTKDTSSDQSQKDKNKIATLSYAVWDKNQEPVMRKLAEEFEKTHPNVKIKVQLTPFRQYWTKLETEANGENVPDVFWIQGPRFQKYAKAKLLMPLTDRIKKDNIDLNNYPQSLIDLYTYKNDIYAIPKDWDTTALWYNKKIFDDAKVPYPTDSWTWDDLRAAAKKLTDKSKGIYGIAAPQEDQQGYYNTIPQCGGFIISEDGTTSGYDKPESIEGIKCWIDLIKDGSSPTSKQLADTQPSNLFESGKLAMVFQGSWMIPEFTKNEYLKDKVDLVVMPKIKKRVAVIHGLGNAIYSKTKHPDEAWEFVKYLGSKEANEIVAKSGVVIPAYKSVLQIFIDANKGYNVKAYVDELEYSYMYPHSVDTAKWNQIELKYFTQVWNFQMSPEDACKKIAEEMNEVLRNEKK